MRKILVHLCFLFLAIIVDAQQQNLPLNYEWNNRLLRYVDTKTRLHTAIKPYLLSEFERCNTDELNELGMADTSQTGIKFGLSKGDMLSIRAKNKKYIYFAINPIMDMQVGYNTQSKSIQHSISGGVQAIADLGSKLTISVTYQGVTENYLQQIKNYATQYGVLTGYRGANINASSISSHIISGYLSLSPNQHFNLQIGNDKNFLGDGYRTFFISDNASNYPYMRMSANFWRFKYVYLLNIMKYGDNNNGSIDNQSENFKTKYGVYHYLSLDATKWFQFGFFEGVTWFKEDSGRVRGMEINYLIPTLFIRPVEFGLGSPDNVTLGMNLKFKPSGKSDIYIQLLLDDMDVAKARAGRGFYRTKVATQLGFRSLDIFKIKHLDLQSEFNLVRPYVFAHKVPAQNYTHFNQSLVHPLGANFWEHIVLLSYWYKHWQASAKIQYAKQGLDRNGEHNGSNVFVSDYVIASDLNTAYNNSFLQGVPTKLLNIELKGGYLLNPKLNLSVDFIYRFRKHHNEYFSNNYHYAGVGIRTGLFNRYSDY